MNRNLILLLAAGALGIILLSLAMKPGSFPGMTPSASPDTQNQTESADATAAKAMVARALEYVDQHGTAALIEKVNAADPEFHYGEHYVFILDNTATIVAHPINPSWIGVDDDTGRDADGNPFFAEMVAAATGNPGGTWFNYRWPNPVTGEVATKSSWVVMHDDHLIGVGIYLQEE